MKMKLLAATALAFAAATPAAAILNTPVAANAYITFGGLDWAWGAPCAPSAPSCDGVDLTYQATQGWRLPTLAEFATGPAASDFIFRGANVPFGGASVEGTTFQLGAPGDGACAAAYFAISFNHCDYSDGAQLGIFGNGGPFTGNPNVETWLVRGAIPEPASWALMIAGFGLVGAAARRHRTVALAA